MLPFYTKYAVDILAFCLMSNHNHPVVVPETGGRFAKGFNRLLIISSLKAAFFRSLERTLMT